MAGRVEDSELFIQAAAEARRASRVYWVEGGPADRKYPVHDDIYRMWPLADKEPEEPRREPPTERGKPG